MAYPYFVDGFSCDAGLYGNGGGTGRRGFQDYDRPGEAVQQFCFFGGLIYVAYRIVRNKKLLKNRMLLKEQLRMEQDERNQYLHDKSGGIIVDILLLSLLFITVTAALFNMAAFYTAITILGLTVVLKAAAYFFFSRR